MLYQYKVMISDDELEMTFRETGFQSGNNLEDAMCKVKNFYGGEDNIIEVSLSRIEEPILAVELMDMNLGDYYRERKWGDKETPPFTL